MKGNALTRREGQGTLMLHAVDAGLYSIHPAPLDGPDMLALEAGELVEVPVQANTPHEIKWTLDEHSAAEKTVHSYLTVGEGKRKRVDLRVSESWPIPPILGGGVVLLIVILLLSGFGINRFLNAEEKVDSLKAAVDQIGFEDEFRLPVGTLMPYAGRLSDPDRDSTRLADLERMGWCPARGQLMQRPADRNSPFWALYDAVDVAWGSEQGQFKLPDLRGQFVRGVQPNCSERTPQDDDYGDCDVGSLQNDATRVPEGLQTEEVGNHNHTNGEYSRLLMQNQRHTVGDIDINDPEPNLGSSRPLRAAGKHSHEINGGDSETRPKNVAVNWLVYVGAASCPEGTTN